jgi:hypothetical protein
MHEHVAVFPQILDLRAFQLIKLEDIFRHLVQIALQKRILTENAVPPE